MISSWFLSVVTVNLVLLSLRGGNNFLATAKYVHRYPYLYAREDDVNASFPVVEHLSPSHRNVSDDTEYDDRPDFLYNATAAQGYRIVEFYIHFCNTCRDFAPVFTKFAATVTDLAERQGLATSLQVIAINCSPNRRLCLDQHARDYPKIRLYRPNSLEYEEIAHHMHLNPYSVLETLGINFDRSESEAVWDMEKELRQSAVAGATNTSTPAWLERLQRWMGLYEPPNPFLPHRTRAELKADIHLSFDFAMRNEVFTSATEALHDHHRKILRQWLDLLLLALPPSWEHLTALVRELVNNFSYVSKSYDYMIAVLDEYPPPTEQWSPGCAKESSGSSGDQGYTCGLWSLFHTVTLGAVDHNTAALQSSSVLATFDVARTMRDYVDSFLSCVVCRTHFVQTFDANCGQGKKSSRLCPLSSRVVEEDPSEWNELPLWLVRTHNAVNERLLRERSERLGQELSAVDIQAVQWPSRQVCPLCWTTTTIVGKNATAGRMATERDLLTPQSDVLLTYLRHEYGQRDAATAQLWRALVELDNARREHPSTQMLRAFVQQDLYSSSVHSSPYAAWIFVGACSALCAAALGSGHFAKTSGTAKKKVD